MSKKVALIVTGGEVDIAQLKARTIDSLADARGMRRPGRQVPRKGARLREECLWIAADKGLEAFADAGLSPDVAVGDFDSVKKEILAAFQEKSGILWERHRPEKDQTDTELALEIAARDHVDYVAFLGATGTRLDHTISNIQLLKTVADLGMQGWILDAHNRIRLCTGHLVTLKRDKEYPYVSFLPWSEEVTHLELSGFKYPLTDYHMVRGVESGRCVSNEITAEEARIEWEDGCLLIIESHD